MEKIYETLRAFTITLATLLPLLDDETLDAVKDVLVKSVAAIDEQLKRNAP